MIKSNLCTVENTNKVGVSYANKMLRVFLPNNYVVPFNTDDPLAGSLQTHIDNLKRIGTDSFLVDKNNDGAYDMTLYLVPPKVLFAYMNIEQLMQIMSMPDVVIEGLEIYGIGYEIDPETITEENPVPDGAIVANDLSTIFVPVSPRFVGFPNKLSPVAHDEALEHISNPDVVLGDAYKIKLEEIRAIPYPDFSSMLVTPLREYINTYNTLYPDSMDIDIDSDRETLREYLINYFGINDES